MKDFMQDPKTLREKSVAVHFFIETYIIYFESTLPKDGVSN